MLELEMQKLDFLFSIVDFLDLILTVVNNKVNTNALPFISHTGCCGTALDPQRSGVVSTLRRMETDFVADLHLTSHRNWRTKVSTFLGHCIRILRVSTDLANAGRSVHLASLDVYASQLHCGTFAYI